MSLQWFKFYGAEYLSDPKISSLTPAERSCWITILCLASISSKIGEIEYLTTHALLQKSGIEWDPYDTETYSSMQGVLQTFERMKMITLSKEGIVTVVNWNKRQEHNLTVAERVAKSRAKKKSVTMNVTSVTPDKTRLDKIRLDKEEKSSETSSQESIKVEKSRAYLKKVPETDLQAMYERFDCSKEAIQSKATDLLLWCETNGKNKKNYRAFLLTALRKDFPLRKALPAQNRRTEIRDGKVYLIED